MHQGIKLKAETLEDLKVVSALLQDAAFKVGDMAYLPKHRRFAFVANRFRWEHEVLFDKPKKQSYQRIRSGLRFEGVLEVRYKNLPALDKSHVLSLLAIEGKKGKGHLILTLNFSGNIAIRLTTEVLEVYLEDITGPWATKNKPAHSVA